MRALVITLAVSLPLALAACGEDESTKATPEEAEHAATPKTAIAEIGKVKAGLAGALADYRRGKAAAAEEAVGDAYLEHFELVEGPLGKVDEELNEDLEKLISTEIRQEMKAGVPAPKVARLVDEAERGLDRAARLLGRS